jgi:cytidyltransferase-like protein
MAASRKRLGSVHGRFQPFHNGHLRYVQAAAERCDYLHVGITQPVIRRLVRVQVNEALHRAQPQSNPLTYFERVETVAAALSDIGLTPERYRIQPFPIEEPDQLPDFLPLTIPVFTTTYDEWNVSKIQTLERVGYEVVNLWSEDRKEVEGHHVRAMIRKGDPRWREYVPPGVADLLEEFDLAGRLRALAMDA